MVAGLPKLTRFMVDDLWWLMILIHFMGVLGILFLYIDIHKSHQIASSSRFLLLQSDISRDDRIHMEKLLRHPVTYQCPDVRKPTYEHAEKTNSWVALKLEHNTNVYFKFAYEDVRVAPAQVRMFTLMPKNVSVFAKFNTICYFWSTKSEEPQICWARHQAIDSVKKINFRGIAYHQDLISCDLPMTGNNVTWVSVAMGNCSQPTFLLPLVNIPHGPVTLVDTSSKLADLSQWKHEFGVCVMISYGYLDDSQLAWFIEWFEFHRLLGVSEFNIYNGTLRISSRIARLWDHYKGLGLLRVHPFSPPVNLLMAAEAKAAAKLSTRASLNDCLYKNMYLYRYVIVVDFDEIIVPRLHQNYHSFVDAATAKYHILPHIKVNSLAFYQNYPRNNSQNSTGLISMEYLHSSPDRRYKAFINPRTCLCCYAHGCDHELQHHKSMYVRRSIGAKVHHYRRVCESETSPLLFSAERCQKLAQQQNSDHSALAFKSALEERVRQVKLQLLGG